MGTPSRRNRQVTRTLEMIMLLDESRNGCSLIELAVKVSDGVATRTVRRDLEAIEAAGFPLYDEVDAEGVRRWSLLTKRLLPTRRAA